MGDSSSVMMVDEKAGSLLDNLRDFSRYYTGHPRKPQISRVIEFKSERQFVELLHEGHPVVVAFTLRCQWTQRFDRVVEDAAAEWYPHIKFMRVECPKYPGFCIARQRKDYPFVEVFHSPKPVSCSFLSQLTLLHSITYDSKVSLTGCCKITLPCHQLNEVFS
jgi:hypothetical protein